MDVQPQGEGVVDRSLQLLTFQVWLGYITVLMPGLALAAHLSVIPQFASIRIMEEQTLLQTMLQMVWFDFATVAVCLSGQVAEIFLINIIRGHPLISLRLHILTVFGKDKESLGWTNLAVLVSATVGAGGGAVHGISGWLLDLPGWGFDAPLKGIFRGAVLVHVFFLMSFLIMELIICASPTLLTRSQTLAGGGLHSAGDLEKNGYGPLEEHSDQQHIQRNMRKGACLLFATIAVQAMLAFVLASGALPIRKHVCFKILFLVTLLVVGLAFNGLYARLMQQRSRLSRYMPTFWMLILVNCFVGVVALIVPDLFVDVDMAVGNVHELPFSGPTFRPAAANSSYEENFLSTSQQRGFGHYPVCDMRWYGPKSQPGQGLTVLDVLVFARAAYLPTEDHMMQEVTNATVHTEIGRVVVEYASPVTDVGRVAVFALKDANLRVLAVRGSSTAADWLFNLDFWAGAVLYQMLVNVLPFASFIPLSFAQQFLAFDVRALLGVQPPWAHVEAAVLDAMARSKADGSSLLMTGHSLGGALASEFAASHGIRAVVFSPVGLGMTSARFPTCKGKLACELPFENNVVSVIPNGDVVPLLDKQVGTNQFIQETVCFLYLISGSGRLGMVWDGEVSTRQ
eukprot:TRINITY_DN1518_c0_g1_i2.p1 TRINITY_DN1518_c0_g1~~TRINITY_DN1518_c0_g1_i2.p1  ORF type:complete len:626 (-),score=61.87 TRINITY_DN1518_c0_g1_i2:6-1883(-)